MAEHEALLGLYQGLLQEVSLPADGFVIGEPVAIFAVEYDGNVRRGITARCRRNDGSEHVVSLADVRFPERTAAARSVATYRRWLGVEVAEEAARAEPPRRLHKAEEGDLDLSGSVDLVVVSVTERAARCRLLHSERRITLKATGIWDAAPGQIITVHPRKQWRYAGHPYLSGEIEGRRVDAAALDLIPLRLEKRGPGRYEMERVVPGARPGGDPVGHAAEQRGDGRLEEAEEALGLLLEADVRCLDAHALLGDFAIDTLPWKAIAHYEVGARIGDLSAAPDFDGVLPWSLAGNRPFLRCLYGYGLCVWRLQRPEDAAPVFERVARVDADDGQGARRALAAVQAGEAWKMSP